MRSSLMPLLLGLEGFDETDWAPIRLINNVRISNEQRNDSFSVVRAALHVQARLEYLARDLSWLSPAQ